MEKRITRLPILIRIITMTVEVMVIIMNNYHYDNFSHDRNKNINNYDNVAILEKCNDIRTPTSSIKLY